MVRFGSGVDFRVGMAVTEFSDVDTCKVSESENDYIGYRQLVQSREF
jgi:hypothetical protein